MVTTNLKIIIERGILKKRVYREGRVGGREREEKRAGTT